MGGPEDTCSVNIVTEARALSRPTFVIKVGDRYYATLALWEYDPSARDLTPEQKRDIAELEAAYRRAREAGPVHETGELVNGNIICFASSRPPPSGPSSV